MKPTARGPAKGHGLAEAVFVALDSLDRMAAAQGPKDAYPRAGFDALPRAGFDALPRAGFDALPRAGFDDIYRFANDPTMTMDDTLARSLSADARLRADLRHLVERAAKGGGLLAAAASSGTITTRHGTSFRMTLHQSRADGNQIYVLIHLAGKGTMAPRTLFVIDDDSTCRKVPLPSPQDGTVQLLLEADSEIVAALRDPTTEVFVQ
jgi:hypothetical protein